MFNKKDDSVVATTETKLEQPSRTTMPNPSWLEERLKNFDRACAAGRRIFVEKELQYEDAIAATGVLGAAVEIIGLAARIKKFVLKGGDGGQSHKAEIMEVAKDLHNYADILMLMAADENWTPK